MNISPCLYSGMGPRHTTLKWREISARITASVAGSRPNLILLKFSIAAEGMSLTGVTGSLKFKRYTTLLKIEFASR